MKFQTIPTDWAGIGNANATIGIPGGQPIPGLSGFGIGDFGLRERRHVGVQRHQDLPGQREVLAVQGPSPAQVRRPLALSAAGLLLLGQRGHARPLRLLGRLHRLRLLPTSSSTTLSAKGRGGLVEPFTHLGHRIGIFAQDDFRVRDDLTLNLGLTWEYTSPWVEKDDRQSNIDLKTGQLLLAGQNGNSRALYDAYYGGFEPRVGFAWTPSDELGRPRRLRDRAVHGRHRQEPAAHRRTRRSTSKAGGSSTPRPAPAAPAVGFADIIPNTSGGPGTLYRIFAPDLRPQLTKQWNVFVERKLTDSLSAQVGYVGSRSSNMVVPFDFNQPEPDPGPVSAVAAARPAAAALSAEPEHRRHERHQLDRRRRVRRAADERASAASRRPGVPRLLHLQQVAERQRRLLRRRLGSDGGSGLLLPRQHRPAARLRTVAVRHAAQLQLRRHLRTAVRQGPQDTAPTGAALTNTLPRRLEPQQHLPDAQRASDYRLRRRRPVAAGDPLAGAAEPPCAGPHSTRAGPTTCGSTSAASSARRRASSATRASASSPVPATGTWTSG